MEYAGRKRSCFAALIVLIATSAASSAERGRKGVLTFVCSGTQTYSKGAAEPVPNIGLVIDLTAREVTGGFGGKIVEVDAGTIYWRERLSDGTTFVFGSIDRVTGEVSAQRGNTEFHLLCKPAKPMF